MGKNIIKQIGSSITKQIGAHFSTSEPWSVPLNAIPFYNAIIANKNKYVFLDRGKKPIDKTHIQNSITLFEKTRTNSLNLTVLGSSPTLWDPIVLQNFGGLSNNPFKLENVLLKDERFKELANQEYWLDEGGRTAYENLEKLVAKDSSFLQTGSILFESKWSPLLNDAMIFGAAAGGNDIVISNDAPKVSEIARNLLWGSKYGLTVLSHELINIHALGYKPTASGRYGMSFTIDKRKKFNFDELGELLQKRSSMKEDDLFELLKKFDVDSNMKHWS